MKGERGGVGGIRRLGLTNNTLLILCIKWTTDENMLYSTGNSPSALWSPKWEGSPKGRGYLYVYG